MTPDIKKTADRMKSVKSAVNMAPFGPKKDAATTHVLAAEKANNAKNDDDTHKSLDAAAKALN